MDNKDDYARVQRETISLSRADLQLAVRLVRFGFKLPGLARGCLGKDLRPEHTLKHSDCLGIALSPPSVIGVDHTSEQKTLARARARAGFSRSLQSFMFIQNGADK